MEPIIIDSDDSYTDSSNNYESNTNYDSTEDYEPIYEGSERETPVIDLSGQTSYSPFDDYEVITTQTVIIYFIKFDNIIIFYNKAKKFLLR